MASKNYRKFMATGVTAAVVASAVAPVASAATFTDVPAGAWYKGAVDYVSGKGYMTGTSTTTFAPLKDITRAEAATLFANKLDLYKDGQVAGYSDVKSGAWYHNAVAAVKEGKIMGSTGGDMFSPDRLLTRGEVAALIVRAYDLKGSGKSTSFTDIDNSIFKNDIATLVEWKIADGKTASTFAPTDVVTRAEMAAFIQKADEATAVTTPAVTSVKAVDANTVQVNFNTAIKDVDHTNFTVNNGQTVVKATLSADKKSVLVDVNGTFTRNQEYTVTASKITNLKDEVAKDLTGKFVWAVEDGITVALKKGSLNVGGTSGLTVKDQDGKDVTGASVVLSSSNTNIISVNSSSSQTIATASIEGEAEGSADVTAVVSLADGTILTNTFKVSVTDVADQVTNQGYTLVASMGAAPQNTVAFTNGSKKTSLYAGETFAVAMYDTVNSDPSTKPVDTFSTVTSMNPIIATASISSGVLSVTANPGQSGTASFEVKLSDGSKRTFSVEVKKEKVLTDISVNATSVKLSDEDGDASTNNFVPGVNEKTVTVTSVDQYGNDINFGTAGKVTVTTNTDGLVLTNASNGAIANNVLTLTGDSASFKIKSTAGKFVNGKVEVKYFKNATDASPTSTKVIDVNVVNVTPASAVATSLDIVTLAEIDAYADYTATTADDDNIAFGSLTAYVLDQNGNRISSVTPTSAVATAQKWVNVTSNTLQFDTDALTLMSAPGTINVDVTASGITKTIPVAYKNSAMVPHKVNVDTKPVAIKLASTDAGASLEEILFGAIDSDQLVVDTDPASDIVIGVKNSATNGGYKYNKPLVSVSDVNGKSITSGVNVYGLLASETVGNAWANPTAPFSSKEFAVDYSIANWSAPTGVTAPTSLTSDINLSAGQTVTFTLVVKGISVASDTNAKLDANLLAAPVTVNVTLTK